MREGLGERESVCGGVEVGIIHEYSVRCGGVGKPLAEEALRGGGYGAFDGGVHGREVGRERVRGVAEGVEKKRGEGGKGFGGG